MNNRYWVKTSDINNVYQVYECAEDQPSEWFVEVEKPSPHILKEIKEIGEFSPFKVKNSKITKDEKVVSELEKLHSLEEEIQALTGTSTEEMVEVLADAILKILPGGLPQMEGYKTKKRKKEEIERVKNKLKGGI